MQARPHAACTRLMVQAFCCARGLTPISLPFSQARRCSKLGWPAGPAGSTSVLAAHSDYVTCLAVPPMQQPTVLASAGLRAEIFVWDLATGTAVLRPVRPPTSGIKTE